MFRSQSSDHHQGSITVLVQLLLIGVHASSYSGMWLYVVCACDVPVREDTTRTGTSYRTHTQHAATYRNTAKLARQ